MTREFYFKLGVSINPSILYLFLILLLSMISISLSEPYWVPFIPEYPEGTPPIMTVTYHDDNLTTIEITVPGMWVDDVEINGIIYQKLELPDYLTLMDVGLPAIPAIGGYVGYLETSDTAINYYDIDTIDLENYNVYPFQEPHLDYEFYSTDFTINNYFYDKDMWYPLERANIGETEIMRDVPVSHFGVVPFEYNPLTRVLRAHPVMIVDLVHLPGGSKGGYGYRSNGIAEIEFAPMYNDLIINYTDLHLIEDTTWYQYDYLILTHPNFLEQAEDLAGYLNFRGRHTYVAEITTSDPKNVYLAIKSFYQSYHNIYVLLIGDIGFIPIGEWYSELIGYIDSDTVYSCLEGGDNDVIPEVALGRLSVLTPDEAELQVDKTKDHYNYRGNNNILKSLLIAHKEIDIIDGIAKYIVCKNKIFNRDYDRYNPNMTFMPGSKPYTNGDVINYINDEHPMIVNYRGHGDRYRWTTWNMRSQNFGFAEIEQVNPGYERPVVLSICCDTSQFMGPNNNFCQEFMKVSGGAVGIIGATVGTETVPNSAFDEWMFRVMYDKGEGHIGKMQNWGKLEMLKTIYKSYYSSWALVTHFSFLLLGDPSLYILPHYYSNTDSQKINKLEDFNLIENKTIPYFNIYPNPSYDIFNIDLKNINGNATIKMYDITGRLVFEENTTANNNTLKIIPSELGISSGLYFINISSSEFNIMKKILYIGK